MSVFFNGGIEMGNLEQAMRDNEKKKGIFRRLIAYGESVKAIDKYNREWEKIRKEKEKKK